MHRGEFLWEVIGAPCGLPQGISLGKRFVFQGNSLIPKNVLRNQPSLFLFKKEPILIVFCMN
jgi:hypothetical protein